MANPVRGEVDLKVDGKTYVLRLGTNALIEVQTVLGGVPPSELAPRMVAPETQAETVRAVLWGALGGSQSGLSLFDAGDLIDDHPEEVAAAIRLVFALAMPDAKDAGGNPRKPGSHGTGKRSSNAGSRSPASRKTSSGR
jgi:hypothetical protein